MKFKIFSLREVGNLFIIVFIESLSNKGKGSKYSQMKYLGSFYLQFEYIKHDLQGLINKGVKFNLAQLKSIMKGVLKGIMYLHSKNIIHRDIKGANILIDENGMVKIADFGLARVIFPNMKLNYTTKVVTLWYRAPEILLGHRNYSDKVDMWSVGCLFYELFTGKVLFRSNNEKDQIEEIFKLCGTPDPEKFKGFIEVSKNYNFLDKSL